MDTGRAFAAWWGDAGDGVWGGGEEVVVRPPILTMVEPAVSQKPLPDTVILWPP